MFENPGSDLEFSFSNPASYLEFSFSNPGLFEFQVYLKKSIVITLKGVFSYSYPVFLKLVLCAGTPQEVRLEQLWNKQNLKLDNLPMKQQQGKGSCQHDRNIILL